jgi:hypothetical protein
MVCPGWDQSFFQLSCRNLAFEGFRLRGVMGRTKVPRTLFDVLKTASEFTSESVIFRRGSLAFSCRLLALLLPDEVVLTFAWAGSEQRDLWQQLCPPHELQELDQNVVVDHEVSASVPFDARTILSSI